MSVRQIEHSPPFSVTRIRIAGLSVMSGLSLMFVPSLICSFFSLFSIFTLSPWAETPKIGFFVPIGGTSATMDFLNLHLLKFTKINDINAESVAFLMK